jgi:hypothetical protein
LKKFQKNSGRIALQSTDTIAPTKDLARWDQESVKDAACAVFDGVFAAEGTGRVCVLGAFEASLAQLPAGSSKEDALRDIAKAAALSTARSHGNIIETGRVLLANIDEIGGKLGLDVRRCKDQVLLGLAEGACQIGPIVYGRFLDIASEYRDNADEWIARNKRSVTLFEAIALPVIVPFEAELTLAAQPFKEVPASLPEPTSAVEPALEQTPPLEPEVATVQWSRPKGKGFFARLSNVMGSLFGRG